VVDRGSRKPRKIARPRSRRPTRRIIRVRRVFEGIVDLRGYETHSQPVSSVLECRRSQLVEEGGTAMMHGSPRATRLFIFLRLRQAIN
jgi:hypothetical protein